SAARSCSRHRTQRPAAVARARKPPWRSSGRSTRSAPDCWASRNRSGAVPADLAAVVAHRGSMIDVHTQAQGKVLLTCKNIVWFGSGYQPIVLLADADEAVVFMNDSSVDVSELEPEL